MTAPNMSIDRLAAMKARYEKHLARASAKPATASGIKGRSIAPAPVEVVEVEVEEDED